MDFVWKKAHRQFQFESFSAKDSVREAAKQLPAFMWDRREKISRVPVRENREFLKAGWPRKVDGWRTNYTFLICLLLFSRAFCFEGRLSFQAPKKGVKRALAVRKNTLDTRRSCQKLGEMLMKETPAATLIPIKKIWQQKSVGVGDRPPL